MLHLAIHIALYLLGGSGFFLSLLALLRATASKSRAASSDGGGTEKDDASTSCTASDEALRRKSGRAAWMAGLASREINETALNGSSRRAMDAAELWMGEMRL